MIKTNYILYFMLIFIFWGCSSINNDIERSEIYFEKPPISRLNIKKEGVIVFNSLSKRSAMTTYRVGWVGGDSELISLYRKVKTNIDSGTPTFIQSGAISLYNMFIRTII